MMDTFEASRIAAMFGEILAFQVDVEAMKAANWMREMQGHTIAYGEESFTEKADQIRAVAGSLYNFSTR